MKLQGLIGHKVVIMWGQNERKFIILAIIMDESGKFKVFLLKFMVCKILGKFS